MPALGTLYAMSVDITRKVWPLNDGDVCGISCFVSWDLRFCPGRTNPSRSSEIHTAWLGPTIYAAPENDRCRGER
jgi:hypothetical protein